MTEREQSAHPGNKGAVAAKGRYLVTERSNVMVSKLRILAALLCILPVTAVEGAYRQLKPVSTKQRSEYSKQITQVLRGTTAPSDALIKNWYLNSLLAELTQPSAGKNAHLARTTIIQNLQTAADRAPAAHGKIRDAVYRYAGALVDPKNNFSEFPLPASRRQVTRTAFGFGVSERTS